MKVKPKHVYIRDDCFSATERGFVVQIVAYRNRVQITAKHRDGAEAEGECSLETLVKILVSNRRQLTE